jgi:hypothetical protein
MQEPLSNEREVPTDLVVGVDPQGRVSLEIGRWPGCRVEELLPALHCDGAERALAAVVVPRDGAAGTRVTYDLAPFSLQLRFERTGPSAVRLTGTLRNASDRQVILDDVALLQSAPDRGRVRFGDDPRQVRVLEQGNYWGRVRPLAGGAAPAAVAAAAEPGGATVLPARASDLVWVAYDRVARQALLVGFLGSERWLGRIRLTATAAGEVTSWRIGFDGGRLAVAPGTSLEIEPLLLLAGRDPWSLLEDYAETVRARHRPVLPDEPVVSWCSWYPYRLGVTEERILENARIAAARLRPLGLKIMEVDLGWEAGNLPSAFQENERFPHGLQWLANQLDAYGFDLGAWKAPFTISEFDPLYRAHPEWLVADDAGRPLAYWE